MSNCQITNQPIQVVSMNLLSDGMSRGEFVTDAGDDLVTQYDVRLPRLASNVRGLFEGGTSILATQENDHPTALLQSVDLDYVEMLMVTKTNAKTDSNSRKIMDGIAPQGWNNKLDDSQPGGRRLHHTDKALGIYSTPNPLCMKRALGMSPSLYKDCDAPHDLELKTTYLDGTRSSPNDSLVIYYDKRSVRPILKEVIQIGVNKKTQFGGSIFKSLRDDKEFLFLNAHLSSGEEAMDADKRREESKTILESIPKILKDHQQPMDLPVIITMDSNSSCHYQLPIEYLKRAGVKVEGDKNGKPIFNKTSVAEKHTPEHPTKGDIVEMEFRLEKFQNMVEEKGNECLKMRGATGGQPKKFGLFMFHTIDKIWIRGVLGKPVERREIQSMSGFNFYPDEKYDIFRTIRDDAVVREKLRQQVIDYKWTDKVGTGRSNTTTQLLPSECYTILPYSAQLHLYPNSGLSTNQIPYTAPSDHPPVGCLIRL